MARYALVTGGYPSAYRQRMASGRNFDGNAPTNEFTEGHADKGVMGPALWDVPVDSVNNRGGLFTHGHVFPVMLKKIEMKISAGITQWVLAILREDGSAFTFASGASTGDIILDHETDEMPILRPKDRIRLTTSGTPSSTSECTVWSQYINM